MKRMLGVTILLFLLFLSLPQWGVCESDDPIENKVQYDSKANTQAITVFFSSPTPEDFTFVIEFDLMDFMEEKEDKTFIFEWYYRSDEGESHTGVVYLPKDAELLDLKYLEPEEVKQGEQVTVCYRVNPGPYNDFRFQLVFSPSGKSYVKLAEQYDEAGNYDLALSYCQKAKSVYGRYSFIPETNPELLRELQERIFAIQKIQADNTYEEALEAFNRGEIGKAKSEFESIESVYRMLKDTKKEAECWSMITECEKILLAEEAERLFEQAKAQYEAGEYTEAKESFIQAKTKFEEVGDTEKAAECKEYLAQKQRKALFRLKQSLRKWEIQRKLLSVRSIWHDTIGSPCS